MSSKTKKQPSKSEPTPHPKSKENERRINSTILNQIKFMGKTATVGSCEFKGLNEALNRCKNVIKMNREKDNTPQKNEKQLANSLDKVTADMQSILTDLRRQLGSIEADGRLRWTEEKIEVVSRQFFADKLLTNGRARRSSASPGGGGGGGGGGVKSQSAPSASRRRREDSAFSRDGGTKVAGGGGAGSKITSGTRLSRSRRLSPSGNAKRENSTSASPTSRPASGSRASRASSPGGSSAAFDMGTGGKNGGSSSAPPSAAGGSRPSSASSASSASRASRSPSTLSAAHARAKSKADSRSSIAERQSVGAKASITSRQSAASASGAAAAGGGGGGGSQHSVGGAAARRSSGVSVRSESSRSGKGAAGAAGAAAGAAEGGGKPLTGYLRKAISDINPLSAIRSEVQKAIRDKKTFTVRGNYPAVRQALVRRGWLEKLEAGQAERGGPQGDLARYWRYTVEELAPLLRVEGKRAVARRLIASKLLEPTQVDFCWSFSARVFREYPDRAKTTIINRFRKDVFDYTTKQGLCEVARNSYWYQIPGVSQINHPRSYSLTRDGDTRGFVHDFGVTAAMSLLKWVVHNQATGESKVISPGGRIPTEAFDFAVNECCRFLQRAQHRDIDEELGEATEHEWHRFLDYFYRLVHIGNHFRQVGGGAGGAGGCTEEEMAARAAYVLDRLREHWPYLDTDGQMNVWILKPTLGCRGQGIHICRTLQYVLNVIKTHPNVRYVIQKYIERPLLIYNTKFDIRQWFLISQASPLTIWIYKDCYLRFSSQTYNLRKLHESIHLTNNAVQARYSHSTGHDANLPAHNMWTLRQFLAHLASIGYPLAYEARIRPGMRQSIAAAVLTHQARMDRRPNSFELYGADFIVAEDFTPWLLEINSSPALYASTPVTAKMCPEVLEDVIKGRRARDVPDMGKVAVVVMSLVAVLVRQVLGDWYRGRFRVDVKAMYTRQYAKESFILFLGLFS